MRQPLPLHAQIPGAKDILIDILNIPNYLKIHVIRRLLLLQDLVILMLIPTFCLST